VVGCGARSNRRAGRPVEGVRSDFALLILRFELLDERGKTTGERRRDDVVLGLETIPNGPEPSGSIGITNRPVLRGRDLARPHHRPRQDGSHPWIVMMPSHVSCVLRRRACSNRGSTRNCSRGDAWRAPADNFRRLARNTMRRSSLDADSSRSPRRIAYAASS